MAHIRDGKAVADKPKVIPGCEYIVRYRRAENRVVVMDLVETNPGNLYVAVPGISPDRPAYYDYDFFRAHAEKVS